MKPLIDIGDRRARAAIFLSGGGSNARVMLAEHARLGAASPLEPLCLVTDNPESGARDIGAAFGLPVIELDIRAFYGERGLARVTVRTQAGRLVREAWTAELRGRLAPFSIDLGVFAGFEPLTNMAEDFPCLNVHPGDLTYLRDGERHLVGLHTVPVERAILAGLTALRSSVILASPFHGDGSDMDSGPILGMSPPVPVDLQGTSVEVLRTIAAERPAVRPPGGYGDLLERIAAHNQRLLKEGGDWVVFPPVVFLAARGRFALGPTGELFFRDGAGGAFRRAKRLVFGRGTIEAEWET